MPDTETVGIMRLDYSSFKLHLHGGVSNVRANRFQQIQFVAAFCSVVNVKL